MLRTSETSFQGLDTVFSQPDDFVAAYHDGAFFVGNESERVGIGELAKFPLCVAESDAASFRALFREHGAAFMPKYVGANTAACLLWAKGGKGVALVPRLSLPMLGYDAVPFKQIEGAPNDGRALTIVAQKKQLRTRSANVFIDVCASCSGKKFIVYRAERKPQE